MQKIEREKIKEDLHPSALQKFTLITTTMIDRAMAKITTYFPHEFRSLSSNFSTARNGIPILLVRVQWNASQPQQIFLPLCQFRQEFLYDLSSRLDPVQLYK